MPKNQTYLIGNGITFPYSTNGRLFEDVQSDFTNILLQYLAVYDLTSLTAVSYNYSTSPLSIYFSFTCFFDFVSVVSDNFVLNSTPLC
jgi:hypothetical protein